jgi:hypothetical protein
MQICCARVFNCFAPQTEFVCAWNRGGGRSIECARFIAFSREGNFEVNQCHIFKHLVSITRGVQLAKERCQNLFLRWRAHFDAFKSLPNQTFSFIILLFSKHIEWKNMASFWFVYTFFRQYISNPLMNIVLQCSPQPTETIEFTIPSDLQVNPRSVCTCFSCCQTPIMEPPLVFGSEMLSRGAYSTSIDKTLQGDS